MKRGPLSRHGCAVGLALALATACDGGRQAKPPREPTGASGPLAATARQRPGEADTVVARVDGLPIYGSCVQAQAARHGALPPDARRRAGLDDCVAFELLAQEAARHGLGADPEVVRAGKEAAANRLVELEIDARVRGPNDLPPELTRRFLERNRWRLHRVEYRASFFVRFPVAKDQPRGGPVDQSARVAAERVAAALAPERGLFIDDVRRRAHELAGAQAMEEGSVDLSDAPRLVPSYSDALFAIEEIGRTSAAVRTDWGWDVILWTEALPARTITEQELAAELFPELRQAYFVAWSKTLGRNVHVEVDPDALAALAPRGVDTPAPEPPPAPARGGAR